MYPILGRYGPYFFYSFTAIWGLGLVLAVGLTAWLARQVRPAAVGWPDGAAVAAVVAVLGGRLGHLVLHQDYYAAHPAEIGHLWQGGLAYHTAVVAGALAFWVWRRRANPPYRDADLLAPALALLSATGWLACLLAGCAYGATAAIGPLTADLPDVFGVHARRYLTQPLGLLWSLATTILALGLVRSTAGRQRLPPGALFWLVAGLLSAGHGLSALFRGDPAPVWAGYRLDFWLDAGLTLLCAFGLWQAGRRGLTGG